MITEHVLGLTFGVGEKKLFIREWIQELMKDITHLKN